MSTQGREAAARQYIHLRLEGEFLSELAVGFDEVAQLPPFLVQSAIASDAFIV
jgi:hypothetical protein